MKSFKDTKNAAANEFESSGTGHLNNITVFANRIVYTVTVTVTNNTYATWLTYMSLVNPPLVIMVQRPDAE